MEDKNLTTSTEERPEATMIGLHSVKNLLGHEEQISLFSEHNVENFSKKYGVKLHSKIGRYGIDLNESQERVMEGILRGFSETNYKGNIEPKDKQQLIHERYAFGELPSTYMNVSKIPCIRVTQVQILEWSGIDKNSIAEKERAIDALKYLGATQYCFYYERLALDKNGAPEKDNEGKWKKQEVIAIDTLFVIKEIRDQKEGRLEYYEIVPSPIFLDQRESYFMLIPYNWREEVRELVGNKKASSYTFRFLLFLRYQYELNKRMQKKDPSIIKWDWEEIAIALKMPESIYKRKKDRAFKIIDNAYSVAKQLGYLKEYKRVGSLDCLILNEQKYYPPKQEQNPQLTSPLEKEAVFESLQLFNFYYDEYRNFNPRVCSPKGKNKLDQVGEFEKLLKIYSYSQIKSVIKLGFKTDQYQCYLDKPSNLRKNFTKIYHQMGTLPLFD